MNAIRKDEEVDNLHSYYVDQWDWERVIEKEDRNITTLKNHVKKIFKVIKHMEHEVWYKYPHVVNRLPDRVHFITAQELENQYPDLTAKERENKICKNSDVSLLCKSVMFYKAGKNMMDVHQTMMIGN